MIGKLGRTRRWLAAGAASLMMLPAAHARPAETGADAEQQQALRGIAMLDQRVAGIAHRLAVSAAPYCAERALLPGFTVHHLSQYSGSYRGAAIRVFGLDRGPRVLALVKGGPAEAAGLERGDAILELDGRPLMAAGRADSRASAGSPHAIARMHDRIARSFEEGPVDVLVERDGRRLTLRFSGEPGCASAVYLEPSGKLNARADGKNVVVTTATAMVANGDDELAAVLAHELAHNLLKHKSRLDSSGWPRECLRQAEIDADRLSVHLLGSAGYDPRAAIRFWRHFGPRKQTLFSGSEHPSWRRRIAIMDEEIASLRRRKADRPNAIPAFQRQSRDGATC